MKKTKNQKFYVWGTIIKDEYIDFDEFNKYPEHLTEFEIDIFTFKLLIEKIIKEQKKKNN